MNKSSNFSSPKKTYEDNPQNLQLTLSIKAESNENEIDLRAYWAIIKKYKWHIIWLSFFVGLLATLYSFSLTLIYQGSTTLLLEINTTNIVASDEVYKKQQASQEYYIAHTYMLQSRVIAEKVIEELDLDHHHEFNPSIKSPPGIFQLALNKYQWLSALFPQKETDDKPPVAGQREAIVQAFINRLTVTQIESTPLIKINFESSDPELAAKVANTLAEIYIKTNMESRVEVTKKSANWLIARLGNMRLNLEKSERDLQHYMEQNSLVDIQGVKSVVGEQVKEVSRNLEVALQELSLKENTDKQLKSLKGYSIKRYEHLPIVLNHPLVINFRQIEAAAQRKVLEMTKRYGSKHPTMVIAQAELKGAQNNTIKQILDVIKSFTKEYEIAKANVSALKKRLRQLKKKVQQITKKEYKFRILQRDVETNRQLYDTFLARLKETDISQNQQSSIGRVVDPAVIPFSATKPQKKLIVILALIIALVLSVMLAFLLDYLDNTLDGEDVAHKLGLPILGILPKLKSKKDKLKIAYLFWQETTSQFTEAIRTIRTGIILSNKKDNPNQVLLITSTMASEGKTSFAINEAFALGQMDKTLLIDADMRNPSVGKLFGFTQQAPGLSELISGVKGFSECIQTMEDIGVDIILSGANLPPNPLELLGSQEFKQILGELEKRYSYILIDSAPVGIVSDALVLSSYADAVVYIVKADSTSYQMVQDEIKRLQQLKTPILGVVLNQLDMKKSIKY